MPYARNVSVRLLVYSSISNVQQKKNFLFTKTTMTVCQKTKKKYEQRKKLSQLYLLQISSSYYYTLRKLDSGPSIILIPWLMWVWVRVFFFHILFYFVLFGAVHPVLALQQPHIVHFLLWGSKYNKIKSFRKKFFLILCSFLLFFSYFSVNFEIIRLYAVGFLNKNKNKRETNKQTRKLV